MPFFTVSKLLISCRDRIVQFPWRTFFLFQLFGPSRVTLFAILVRSLLLKLSRLLGIGYNFSSTRPPMLEMLHVSLNVDFCGCLISNPVHSALSRSFSVGCVKCVIFNQWALWRYIHHVKAVIHFREKETGKSPNRQCRYNINDFFEVLRPCESQTCLVLV